MLTDKQEKYVLGLIEGKSQRAAYKAAYDTARMKDATVDKRASELFQHRAVRGRFDELQGAIRDAAVRDTVASAVEVLEELTAIGMGRKKYPTIDMFGNEHKRDTTVNERIKALELLGKHHGAFMEKLNHSGGLDVRTDKLTAILEQLTPDDAK